MKGITDDVRRQSVGRSNRAMRETLGQKWTPKLGRINGKEKEQTEL